MATATCTVVRGLNGTHLPDTLHLGIPARFHWSNNNFKQGSPSSLEGSDPIDLILQLLTSTGDANNGSYDIFEGGIGLGIPQSMIDISSFTAIQAQYDYDRNQRVFFIITEPQDAKQWLEQELCAPFGLYLVTGNDGLIRCVRPKHPQKFHIAVPNNQIDVSGVRTLDTGVYTAQELAAHIQTKLAGNYSCTYDTGTHKFTISNSTSFTTAAVSGNLGWTTLGWTTFGSGTTTTADLARGAYTAPASLTKNDLWNVQLVDNRDDQITSVIYEYDYHADQQTFVKQKAFINAEAVNLGDILGAHNYVIKSKGLISANSASAADHFSHWTPPGGGGGCDPQRVNPNNAFGVDAATWSQLYAMMLLDRYKQPPIKFKAKLKWKWNFLEVGDVVSVTYDIPGVFIDYERAATTLTNRLFEITELHPNFDGSLEATFLGHRYVNY